MTADPIKELMADAIIHLIPLPRDPSKRCWCPSYVDLSYGHSADCKLANAALTAFEAEKAGK